MIGASVPRLSFAASDPLGPMEKGICVNTHSEQAALSFIRERLSKREGFALATINLYHVVKLSHDEAYYKAYRQHDAVVADGFPIVWLGRMLGQDICRTTGSDLVLPIVSLVHEMGGTLAMVGTTKSALETASGKFRQRFPGLKIVFTRAPPFGFDPKSHDAEALMDDIRKSDAWICLLAFGAPKQEILAALGKTKAPKTGFISIGAGVDFIAGSQIRAPIWVRRINMEWFWRMALSPKRLFIRYLLCALVFPALLCRSAMKRKAAPPSAANPGYSSGKLP
ncbi:MAG: WecB/TagA/CpsF family glycosyltransferase [Alphaproteobacteria bacterium]|nr:WecB/TagA/CpsF family glycosyltransferase [Alphaproteobacteria bacterium]